jgi:NADH pyrophosphatase NudC (nudix superfamily)
VDCDADTLTLQKEEVEDARFFTLDQFKSMTHADRGMMVPHENYYEHIIDTIVKKIS